MATEKVTIRPGVNRQATQLLNEMGWSFSGFIRFKDGFVEKIRGWVRFLSQALIGKCRFILAWQSLSGIPYLAFGTHKRLQVFSGGDIYDITPLRTSVDLTPAFTTAIGDTTVIVEDAAHGATDGDAINLVTPIAVGGLLLSGYYEVTVIDTNNYSIEATEAATANVTDGGTTAEYTTTNGSPDVDVVLENHGLEVDQFYTVYVSTAVGGLTLKGDYIVSAVADADNFTFTAEVNASSDDSEFENTGDAKIDYLISPGLEDAAPAQGYGIGGYGEGLYGYGDDSDGNAPPRHWSGLAWGEDGIFSPTNGAIYLWDSSAGVINNPATEITQAPSMNTQILIAMPQQQVIALGAEDNNVQDPLLVKWCNVRDYTKWRNLADAFDPNSQAGFFRIPKGGKIVGGRVTPHQIMIWTDVGVWLMQYLRPPLLYGFDEIATGCGLIGPRAMGVIGSTVFWASDRGIFMYDGSSVRQIPCDVWDEFFNNLTQEQAYKVECKENAQEGEIAWSAPGISGENDMEIKLRVNEGLWDYTHDTEDNLVGRTAWLDWSLWGAPIAVRADGVVCQHEIGFDDLENPLEAFITSGWFKISNGEYMIQIHRLIPDFVLSAGDALEITVLMKDYPNDDTPVREYGPFTITAATKYVIVRGRGRLASLKISSSDEGVSWRLGQILYTGAPAGRRP
jgi:hypothetical protein